eukprot:3734118-Pyramimonas_sp.AAC.1
MVIDGNGDGDYLSHDRDDVSDCFSSIRRPPLRLLESPQRSGASPKQAPEGTKTVPRAAQSLPKRPERSRRA